METRCAGTTVSVEVSVRLPTFAVIVVWPAATVDPKPEPLIVATDAADEVQVTPEVRSAVLPSL
jgi:hypothetical protein